MDSKWFYRPAPNPTARLRLFCFPYAGGSTTIYRRWPELLPPEIEVVAVEPPGRGRRFAEALHTDAAALIDALIGEMPAMLDRPAAFFGYSMGALLAYELAQRLKQRYGTTLTHLLIAACPAPHLPDNEAPSYNLSPAAFRRRLEELNGTPKEILDHPELYALVEPILRADFQICNTYRRHKQAPLTQPLTAFGGQDDRTISAADLDAWRETTSGAFQLQILPGDHFFLHTQAEALLEMVARALT